jgi:hypothetical protein
MPKAYSKFTFDDLITLGFSIENDELFKGAVIVPIEPSSVLTTIWYCHFWFSMKISTTY